MSNLTKEKSALSGGNGSLVWPGTEIPSLYGIRGVAALAVLFGHIGLTAPTSGTNAVICFFVLSGFLITHLLLKEYDKTGDVSLRRFYLRRALRIFPAFYGFGFVYIVGRLLMHFPINWPATIGCLTYTTNYYNAFTGLDPTTMGHTWSLAVEEQFYLLWPFVFWKLAGNRLRLMKVLMTAIFLIWAYRWVGVQLEDGVYGNHVRNYIWQCFENRADALALGCLLAVANREKQIPRWLIDWKWLGLAAILAIITSAVLNLNGPRYAWSLAAVGFAILLVQAIEHHHTIWYKWLNSKPLYGLGVISYSLYLYHQFANQLKGMFHYGSVRNRFLDRSGNGVLFYRRETVFDAQGSRDQQCLTVVAP